MTRTADSGSGPGHHKRGRRRRTSSAGISYLYETGWDASGKEETSGGRVGRFAMTGNHASRDWLRNAVLQLDRNLTKEMIGDVLHILRSPQCDMLSAAAGNGADTGRMVFVVSCAVGLRNGSMLIVIVMRNGGRTVHVRY